MGFQIKANPTFEASLTIVGQGREQKLSVTYRHKTSKEYAALLDRLGNSEIDIAEAVLELVDKWDADAPLSRQSLEMLQDEQPGADFAILNAYGEALTVARKKN